MIPMKLTFNIPNLFTVPTSTEIAQNELAEAQRQLLKAQSGLEYARSMVQYHEARIKRLTEALKSAA